MGQAKQRGTLEERIAAAQKSAEFCKIARKSIISTNGRDIEYLTIPRAQVENSAPQSLIELLHSLVATPEMAAKKAQSVVVAFDGYDDDPREIFMVPEVRSFLEAVATNCPWFLHVLKPDSYFVWFASIIRIVDFAKDSGKRIRVTFDTPQLRAVAQTALAEVRKLHLSLNMPFNDGDAFIEDIAGAVKAFLSNVDPTQRPS